MNNPIASACEHSGKLWPRPLRYPRDCRNVSATYCFQRWQIREEPAVPRASRVCHVLSAKRLLCMFRYRQSTVLLRAMQEELGDARHGEVQAREGGRSR